jgi:hypothetical protein
MKRKHCYIAALPAVLTLAFGLVLAACGGGGLTGRWSAFREMYLPIISETIRWEERFEFSGNTWTYGNGPAGYDAGSEYARTYYKGTYTVNGSTITFNFTHEYNEPGGWTASSETSYGFQFDGKSFVWNYTYTKQ